MGHAGIQADGIYQDPKQVNRNPRAEGKRLIQAGTKGDPGQL